MEEQFVLVEQQIAEVAQQFSALGADEFNGHRQIYCGLEGTIALDPMANAFQVLCRGQFSESCGLSAATCDATWGTPARRVDP